MNHSQETTEQAIHLITLVIYEIFMVKSLFCKQEDKTTAIDQIIYFLCTKVIQFTLKKS